MKKILKNPWAIGVGTGLIAGVLSTFIVDLLKKVSLASTFKSVIKFIWKCIVSFLAFNIKVWWLLIAIGVLVFALWIISKYYDAKEENEQTSFLNYTQDSFSGKCWEWVWRKNRFGKYVIDNLHPICSNCKTPLVQDHAYSDDFKCPRCNKKAKIYSNDVTNATTLIYDNVKREYFSKENI